MLHHGSNKYHRRAFLSLRPENTLHESTRVSTEISSPLSYVGGKFFNKEKSELQRHREKEGGGVREEGRERERRERYRNERTGR